ncbi:DUF2149 domain-containing protein [Colwellia sp. UCD-KL20]|uniref:DUF2149 domain-containing protein n=1 Tax=Colwellia sp. UCD-KL20 TaxID=1917165 RepID=UPI0009703265|nr:DUF2149 domain-containing protein [Colwellia sp. UCD-KL20]
MSKKSSWQSSQFAEQDSDPLAGFANIMDVMLVFALGLMLALVAQSKELQKRFSIESNKTETIEVTEALEVTAGTELIEAPESISNPANAKANGMESLGQVYKDPKTGKLILISGG